MQIVGIDPSYKKIGAFRIKTHPSDKDIIFDLEAYLFKNSFSSDFEDKFLYQLASHLKRNLGTHGDFFLVLEYTYVPRFRSAPSINRVIGVIYATLHPFLTGFYEVNMNTIYSFYKARGKANKKEELKNILLPTLPDLVLFREIDLFKDRIYIKKIGKEELPEDCLDAYALVRYLWQLDKK